MKLLVSTFAATICALQSTLVSAQGPAASSTQSSSNATSSGSLYLNVNSVVQCGTAQVSWGGGQPPYNIKFQVSSGTAPAPTWGTYDTSVSVPVDLPSGSSFTAILNDNRYIFRTQQYTVGGSNDASCLTGSAASSAASSSVASSSSAPAPAGGSTIEVTPSSPASSAAGTDASASAESSVPATSATSSEASTTSDGTLAAAGSTGVPVEDLGKKKSNTGAIAGGVVGGLAALAAIAAVALIAMRRRRRQAESERPVYRRWSEGQPQRGYTYEAEEDMMEK